MIQCKNVGHGLVVVVACVCMRIQAKSHFHFMPTTKLIQMLAECETFFIATQKFNVPYNYFQLCRFRSCKNCFTHCHRRRCRLLLLSFSCRILTSKQIFHHNYLVYPKRNFNFTVMDASSNCSLAFHEKSHRIKR